MLPALAPSTAADAPARVGRRAMTAAATWPACRPARAAQQLRRRVTARAADRAEPRPLREAFPSSAHSPASLLHQAAEQLAGVQRGVEPHHHWEQQLLLQQQQSAAVDHYRQAGQRLRSLLAGVGDGEVRPGGAPSRTAGRRAATAEKQPPVLGRGGIQRANRRCSACIRAPPGRPMRLLRLACADPRRLPAPCRCRTNCWTAFCRSSRRRRSWRSACWRRPSSRAGQRVRRGAGGAGSAPTAAAHVCCMHGAMHCGAAHARELTVPPPPSRVHGAVARGPPAPALP